MEISSHILLHLFIFFFLPFSCVGFVGTLSLSVLRVEFSSFYFLKVSLLWNKKPTRKHLELKHLVRKHSCIILWQSFILVPWFWSANLIRRSITANQYIVILTLHLYATMENFYPNGSDLFHDTSAPTHRAKTLYEWFDEDENNLNHML